MASHRGRPQIAVVMSEGTRYTRLIFRGVTEFAHAHPQAFHPVHVRELALLAEWPKPPAGIVTLITNAAMIRSLRAIAIPAVNVSARFPKSLFPQVVGDDEAIGRVAAAHLLDRGFSRFAFYGNRDGSHYASRYQGFERAIRETGMTVDAFWYELKGREQRPGPSELRRLDRWLRALTTPVALFCGTDWAALHIYEACDRLGLRVRDDVALLGVGDDDFICQTCDPPLSSIENRPQQIGWQAAALLEKLIRGERMPREPVRVPPAGVVERGSTDVFASTDPHVATVLRYIQQNLHRPLHVVDLVRLVPLSRRALERRFRDAVGRTILDEIHHRKIERIRHLLASTDQSIETIATACGFGQSANMTALFRKILGITPGAYRERLHRATASP